MRVNGFTAESPPASSHLEFRRRDSVFAGVAECLGVSEIAIPREILAKASRYILANIEMLCSDKNRSSRITKELRKTRLSLASRLRVRESMVLYSIGCVGVNFTLRKILVVHSGACEVCFVKNSDHKKDISVFPRMGKYRFPETWLQARARNLTPDITGVSAFTFGVSETVDSKRLQDFNRELIRKSGCESYAGYAEEMVKTPGDSRGYSVSTVAIK